LPVIVFDLVTPLGLPGLLTDAANTKGRSHLAPELPTKLTSTNLDQKAWTSIFRWEIRNMNKSTPYAGATDWGVNDKTPNLGHFTGHSG
jgi:hypothetical protein